MSEYNPSEHNIEDVNKYLEENPTQLQAVLDAEKAFGNKSGSSGASGSAATTTRLGDH